MSRWSSRTNPAGLDSAGLGRGRLTRWLPVLGQVPADPPPMPPFAVEAGLTPRRFVLRAAFSVKRLTLPGAAAAIVFQIGQALIPVVAGLAIDRALGTGNTGQLVLWLALLALNVLALAVGFRVAALLTMRSIQLLQHRLRVTLSARVLHPLERPVSRASGAVLSTTTNDVMRLADVIVITVFSVAQIAAVGFIAVTLLTIHWPLGLIVIGGVPIVVGAVSALRSPFTRRTQHSQTLLAHAVGQATDLVTGYRVIKGIHAEDEATRRYHRSSREALSGALDTIGALGRYLAASNAISTGFTGIVTAIAALYTVHGHLSVGELIAVVGLTQALLSPLTLLTSEAGTTWASAVASAARILDLLTASTEPTRTPSPPIRLDESAVASTPSVELHLHGSDPICVEPGELVGLRGDDRTAARLVDALLHPEIADDVQVAIDGVPATQLDRTDYRSLVVVAPHAATLFSGTIADNLATPGAPAERRAEAIHAAACEDFTAGLDGAGLEGDVGENGNRLSGGQRQRLALARALGTDAPILVLHDPTTSVDSVTEATIASRLPDICRGRSTLLIASSPALLAACDRIIDLPRTRNWHGAAYDGAVQNAAAQVCEHAGEQVSAP
ncbi:ABC transporter transmembrane domain-containing protein [Candidatus Corynebacterium faecigallinarum]|uniref:ABC transporter transmembrane domain-containing protein n=1 Tax=Candidatus Corynebacterium faecigallinarum TaxID=2838528 RepID=UPI003FB726A2